MVDAFPGSHFERYIIDGGYRFMGRGTPDQVGLLALRGAIAAGLATRYLLAPGGAYYMPNGGENVPSGLFVVAANGLLGDGVKSMRPPGGRDAREFFSMPAEASWKAFGPAEDLGDFTTAITLHSLVRHIPSTQAEFADFPQLPPPMPSQF